MEGIDIYSKFQTVNSWTQVRAADIGWCYQKVSDGTGIRSVQTPDLGHAAGVAQGGYHFSQPGDPVAQANLLVDRCIVLHMLDLRPALDLEDNPPGLGPNIPDSQKADWAVAFGRQVQARGHGFTLYANDSTWGFIKTKVRAALPDTFKWVARYRVAPPDNPWDAWQYTSSGNVPGIAAGSVDRNKGAIPFNTGGNMPLDAGDKAYIEDQISNHPGWWYAPRFAGNLNYAQVVLGMRDTLNATQATLGSLVQTVINNEANDVTVEQLVTQLTPAMKAAIVEALADVKGLDETAVANATAARFAQLLGVPPTV